MKKKLQVTDGMYWVDEILDVLKGNGVTDIIVLRSKRKNAVIKNGVGNFHLKSDFVFKKPNDCIALRSTGKGWNEIWRITERNTP